MDVKLVNTEIMFCGCGGATKGKWSLVDNIKLFYQDGCEKWIAFGSLIK